MDVVEATFSVSVAVSGAGSSLVDVSAALAIAGPEDVVAILANDDDLLGVHFAPADFALDDGEIPSESGLIDPFDDADWLDVTDDGGSSDDDLFAQLDSTIDHDGRATADSVVDDIAPAETDTSPVADDLPDNTANDTEFVPTPDVAEWSIDDADTPWEVPAGFDLGATHSGDAEADDDDIGDDWTDDWSDDAG